MRFHLIDRLDAWEPGRRVRATKLASLSEELLERDRQLQELIGHLQVERREERAQDRRVADVTFIASQVTAR